MFQIFFNKKKKNNNNNKKQTIRIFTTISKEINH